MTQTVGKSDPHFAILGEFGLRDGKHSRRWAWWLRVWHKDAQTTQGDLIPMMVAIGNQDSRRLSS